MELDLSGLRRYELKYTITEAQARAIRDFILPFCSLDRHVASGSGYTVNNIYLDTPGLRFYYDTKFKQERRLKSRVRYYGSEPGDFAVLEIKHRHNTISWKRRRRIAVAEWPGVLDVRRAERAAATYADPPETFEEVNHIYCTTPVLHVRYFREPYVSDIDEYGRVTFDRSMRFRLAHGSYELGGLDEDMTYYDDPVTALSDDSPVVLEIKTQAFVPAWAIELIRRFSLMQRGFSKYCYAIDQCLEQGHDAAGLAL